MCRLPMLLGVCPVHKQAMSPNDFDRKSDGLIHSALLLNMPGASLNAMPIHIFPYQSTHIFIPRGISIGPDRPTSNIIHKVNPGR